MNIQLIDNTVATDSHCTSHCVGQSGPACGGGGHCQANIRAMLERRPTRRDTVALLDARELGTEPNVVRGNFGNPSVNAAHCHPGPDTSNCTTACVAAVRPARVA